MIYNKNYRVIYRKGFTLVELLVVIVVISILASIITVSYIGTKNQARGEKTKTNAASVKKVAEAYYTKNNVYPTQVAQFSTTYTTMPTDIVLLTSGTLSDTNGEKSIMYRYINSGAGACIMRWDYAPTSGSPGIVTTDIIGTATSGNCNATTGTLPS